MLLTLVQMLEYVYVGGSVPCLGPELLERGAITKAVEVGCNVCELKFVVETKNFKEGQPWKGDNITNAEAVATQELSAAPRQVLVPCAKLSQTLVLGI